MKIITKEVKGNIFNAKENLIAFAVNIEGINDSGLAGKMFETYPELHKSFPMFKPIKVGTHFVPVSSSISENRTLCLVCCHSLKASRWNYIFTEMAIDDFKNINEEIAIVKIGTGIIGKSKGTDWHIIRKILEDSPAKFVIYSI